MTPAMYSFFNLVLPRFVSVRLSAFLAVLALGAVSPEARATPLAEEWRWVHFGWADGLPGMRMVDVVETQEGTPWALTDAGLAWYDGFDWHALGATGGLPEGAVVGLRAHEGDRVVVIMSENRCFIGNQHGFTPFPMKVGGERLRRASTVYAGRGEWFSANSKGLYRCVEGGCRRIKDAEEMYVNGYRFSSGVTWQTRPGGVWVKMRHGLVQRVDNGWVTRLADAKTEQRVLKLAENEQGSGLLEMVTPLEQKGLWEWAPGQVPRYNAAEGKENIRAMDVAPDGDAVVVYESGHVRLRRQGVWGDLAAAIPALQAADLVKFRANGDLWVGGADGLRLYRRAAPRWTRWSHPFPNLKNTVQSLLAARDGAIWIGTESGVEVRHPDGRTEAIERIGDVDLRRVTGLAEDAAGHVWISSGAAFYGAFRWDGRAWRHFGAAEGLAAPMVHKMVLDMQGRLWFLGMKDVLAGSQEAEPGALVFDGEEFVRWSEPEGLPSGRVYDFVQGADGGLWFATINGLARWRDGGWTYWGRKELKHKRVFSLFEDGQGRLWFGSKAGLGYIDETDGAHLVTEENVFDIAGGPDGRVWYTTSDGLFLLHEDARSEFAVQAGLLNTRLWPLLVRDRRVYAGTIGGGVNILNLDSFEHPPPRLHFEKPVVQDDGALLRWRAAAWWGTQNERHIPTRHRLDDGAWSDWGTRREISLQGLEPGPHVFQVQAKDLLGRFDPAGARAAFDVAPPFYRTVGFLVPVAALSGAVVVLLGIQVRRKRRYTSMLEEKNAALAVQSDELASKNEALERQAEELERNNRELSRSNAELQEFAYVASHDLQEPLRKIQAFGDRLQTPQVAGALSERGQDYVTRMQKAARRMQQLIQDLLTFSRVSTDVQPFAPVELGQVVDEALNDLSAHIEAQKADITVEALGRIEGDAMQLSRLMQNLLSNALKYHLPDRAPRVRIYGQAVGAGEAGLADGRPGYRLYVADEGIGFEEKYLDRIFTVFQRLHERSRYEGTGIGLAVCRKIVERHGGHITATSAPGQGATFIVTLPQAGIS